MNIGFNFKKLKIPSLDGRQIGWEWNFFSAEKHQKLTKDSKFNQKSIHHGYHHHQQNNVEFRVSSITN